MAFGLDLGTMKSMSSWSDALQLLMEARQAGHEDIVAYNQLLSRLSRAFYWFKGLEVLHRGLSRRLQATQVTYNATSSCFEKASRWQHLLCAQLTSTSMANSALTACAWG